MLLFLVQFGTEFIFHCLLLALFSSAEKKHAEAHSHSLSTSVLSQQEPENVSSENKPFDVTDGIIKSVIALEWVLWLCKYSLLENMNLGKHITAPSTSRYEKSSSERFSIPLPIFILSSLLTSLTILCAKWVGKVWSRTQIFAKCHYYNEQEEKKERRREQVCWSTSRDGQS